MKNVIIVSSSGARYAFELRWVREVVSLGHVTRVPGAPPHIAGVVNVHGSITPVLEVAAFGALGEPTGERSRTSGASGVSAGSGSGGRPGTAPQRGDGAVLVEVEDMVAAIRMDAVDEVSTVAEKSLETSRPGTSKTIAPGGDAMVRAGIVSGAVEDSRGRQVWLIDPARMLEMAKSAALEAGAGLPGSARGASPSHSPDPGAGHGAG